MATNKLGKYDDIIDLPHHRSAKHPHMTPMERAAQFSPFAALTGHEDTIAETGRLVDPRLDLTEEEENFLDRTLQELQDRISEKPTVQVLYFVPDERKQGGTYRKKVGIVRRVNETDGTLTFTDGTVLKLMDVVHIKIENE